MKIIIILALALSMFVSCDEMNDLHQKYLDEGEVVYIGQADSVTARDGYKRIEVKWEINSDPKITSCRIYWNSRRDSVIVPVDLSTSTPSAIISPLKEGRYNFELVQWGGDGNHSLTTYVSGRVYGDEYRNSLAPQGISEISSIVTPSDKDVTIKWAGQEKCIGMKMTYTNTSDQLATQMTWTSSGLSTLITDAKLGSKFTYESFYHPSENALDTVTATEIGEGNFPAYYTLSNADWADYSDDHTVLATTGWAIDANSEHTSDTIGNILDGKTSTIWHCSHSASLESMPYIINLDMLETKIVSSISLERRTAGGGSTKLVNIEYSTDELTWLPGGSVAFPNNAVNIGAMVCFPIDEFEARYLRLTIPKEGGSFENYWANLSELVITTPK